MDEQTQAFRKNAQITEYLDHYISSRSSINLAVALTGGWGSGKTYFVKNYLNTRFTNPRDYVLISLFGISSVEEISSAFYHAIYPFLDSKAIRIGSELTKTALAMFRITPKLKLSDFKDPPSAKIYIFDDVERCSIPLDTLLGFINSFTEDLEAKVILIINEGEIGEKDNYFRKKEKIIGISLEVSSDIESAFETFVNELNETQAKSLIRSLKQEILEIYYNSGIKSLRIMQVAMECAERLCTTLSEAQLHNRFAMRSVLGLVFAWSYELRSGRLSEKELRERESFFYTLDSDDKALMEARDRYGNFDICNPILTSEILVGLLIHGHIDSAEIQASVEASLEFGYANQSSWRIAWHAATVTDEDFDSAFSDMMNRFIAREYVKLTELIHVLGIILWASKIDYIQRSQIEIKDSFFKYIDDIYDNNLLPPIYRPRDHDYESALGLGFKEKDTPEFQACLEYLNKRRHDAASDHEIIQANNVLTQLENEIHSFCTQLTGVPGGVPWARINFLHHLPHEKFANTLIQIPPSNFELACRTLALRYNDQQTSTYLSKEKLWFGMVIKSLKDLAISAPPLRKYRLDRVFRSYFDDLL